MSRPAPRDRSPSPSPMTELQVACAVFRLRGLWALACLGVWCILGLGALSISVGVLQAGAAGSGALVAYVALAVLTAFVARERRPIVRALKASIVIDLGGTHYPAMDVARRYRKDHMSAVAYAFVAPSILLIPIQAIWPSDEPSTVVGAAELACCLLVYIVVTRWQRRAAGLDAPRLTVGAALPSI